MFPVGRGREGLIMDFGSPLPLAENPVINTWKEILQTQFPHQEYVCELDCSSW
jgi:hypothetical protein